MNEPTRRERLQYRFDTWMSKGTIALIGLLGVATFVFVLVMGVIVWALPLHPADEPEGSFLDMLWGNLMRTLDPGTMGGDPGWGFRDLDARHHDRRPRHRGEPDRHHLGRVRRKVEELRKGRSRVLEKDHTLILGWSDKVFSIVSRARDRQRVARQARDRHPRRPRQGRDGGRSIRAAGRQDRQDAGSSAAPATR